MEKSHQKEHQRVQFKDEVTEHAATIAMQTMTPHEHESTWWSHDELRQIMDDCHAEVKSYQSTIVPAAGDTATDDEQEQRNHVLLISNYRGVENLISNRPYRLKRRQAIKQFVLHCRQGGNDKSQYEAIVTKSTVRALEIASMDERVASEYMQEPTERTSVLPHRKSFFQNRNGKSGSNRSNVDSKRNVFSKRDRQQVRESKTSRSSTTKRKWSTFFIPSSWSRKQ